jgi:hypothetical protein
LRQHRLAPCDQRHEHHEPFHGNNLRGDDTTPAVDVHVTAARFRSLKTMTPIRGFFVANLLGNLAGTVAVANSRNGGVYPTGTLLQLVPQEAMVKHRPGWNRALTGSSSRSTCRGPEPRSSPAAPRRS